MAFPSHFAGGEWAALSRSKARCDMYKSERAFPAEASSRFGSFASATRANGKSDFQTHFHAASNLMKLFWLAGWLWRVKAAKAIKRAKQQQTAGPL